MTGVVYRVERWNGPLLVDADSHRLDSDGRLVLYRDGRYVCWFCSPRWVSFTRCELVPVETHVRTEKAS